MFKFVFSEIKKLIIPSLLVILSCTVYYFFYYSNYFKTHVIYLWLQPWSIGGLFELIFPILVAVPYCWQVFYEKKGNYFQYVHTRTSLKKYLVIKCIIGALLSGLTIVIVNLIGLIIAYNLGINGNYVTDIDFYIHIFFLGEFQYNSPFIYGLLLSLWRGFAAVLMCVFGFTLSLAIKNIFAAITAPFIYYTLENYLTSFLLKSQISFSTSISPNRITVDSTSYATILSGPAILCVAIGFVLLWLWYSNKEQKRE